ncbi:hypothetical protein [Lyngbya confervoides]|uniref:Uncharacterized protein n=1 Tax=Lyngbya confervoides BDU141951 TaxID=1574623 RepID=A0ABD4T6A7_9CYAN|nr:hypothetical protein [Lyngbya confervoides]MCM1983802.1 hypothetical protein [Lyngbya confervoides BDU141951]
MKKEVRLLFLLALALAGTAYFTSFEQLNVPMDWMRAYAALIPIQFGILFYLLWQSRKNQRPE